MRPTPRLLPAAVPLALIAVVALIATTTPGAQQAAGPAPRPFNGITTGVGDLSRLSKARTRSISPENFTGAKGEGGKATEGTGAGAARDLGRGWKVSPSVKIAAEAGLHPRRDHRPRRHSAHLDDADRQLALRHPARLLGRRDDAVDRSAARRLLRLGLGTLRPDRLARRHREPGQRLQQLLVDAVPQVGAHDRREHRRRRRWSSTTRSPTR